MPRGGRRQRLDGPIQGNPQRCFQEIARCIHSLTRSLIPFHKPKWGWPITFATTLANFAHQEGR